MAQRARLCQPRRAREERRRRLLYDLGLRRWRRRVVAVACGGARADAVTPPHWAPRDRACLQAQRAPELVLDARNEIGARVDVRSASAVASTNRPTAASVAAAAEARAAACRRELKADSELELCLEERLQRAQVEVVERAHMQRRRRARSRRCGCVRHGHFSVEGVPPARPRSGERSRRCEAARRSWRCRSHRRRRQGARAPPAAGRTASTPTATVTPSAAVAALASSSHSLSSSAAAVSSPRATRARACTSSSLQLALVVRAVGFDAADVDLLISGVRLPLLQADLGEHRTHPQPVQRARL